MLDVPWTNESMVQPTPERIRSKSSSSQKLHLDKIGIPFEVLHLRSYSGVSQRRPHTARGKPSYLLVIQVKEPLWYTGALHARLLTAGGLPVSKCKELGSAITAPIMSHRCIGLPQAR